MKKMKILSLVLFVLAVVLIVFGLLFPDAGKDILGGGDTSNSDSITTQDIISKISNTSCYEYISSMQKIEIKDETDKITVHITGVFNDKTMDRVINIEKLSDNKLKITVDESQPFDNCIYEAVVDAVFQVNGYPKDSTSNMLFLASDETLNSLGITKENKTQESVDYIIDYNKHEIPANVGTITAEYLKTNGYADRLLDYGNFNFTEGNLIIFKTATTGSIVKITIVDTKNLSNDTYNAILGFAEVLLSTSEYNEFVSKFRTLESIKHNNFEVIVNYEPPLVEMNGEMVPEETFDFPESASVVRILYDSSSDFELPAIEKDEFGDKD